MRNLFKGAVLALFAFSGIANAGITPPPVNGPALDAALVARTTAATAATAPTGDENLSCIQANALRKCTAAQLRGNPAYLGVVSTRLRVPDTSNTTNVQNMTRRADYARSTITNPIAIYGNFVTTTTGEAGTGGTLTITGAIEYPAGTYTQMTFGGATSVTMADGQSRQLSDPVPVTIPAGAAYWIRTWASASVAAPYFSVGYYAGAGDMVTIGATVADATMASFTGAGSGVGYGPIALIASTRLSSVAVVGDSQAAGTTATAATYIGYAIPALAPSMGVLNLSRSSQSASQLVSSAGGFTKRAEYLQYVTHGLMQIGVNDINSGRTAVQVAADRLSIAQTYGAGLVWGQTTITPLSTDSSTSFTTLYSQGVSSAKNTERVSENTAVRAGQPGFSFVFDLADGAESSRNSGRWATVIAPNAGFTADVTAATTADGTHANDAGFARINERVRAEMIRRPISALTPRDMPRLPLPANDNAAEVLAA